jgi:glycosyltransferase involved in cell wall biosynthesis
MPPTPIRIAFCITGLEPGGAEKCLVELVKRLDRQQFEAVVYCLGPRPRGNPDSLADQLEAASTTVVCFDARRSIDAPRTLWRLRRRMRRDRPDIVQGFLFHANVLGSLAALLAGVPHVVTGIRVAEQRGQRYLAAARVVDRWVERHVCVSQAVKDFSHRRGGLPESKLVVIPNGVDVARFDAATPVSLERLGVPPGRRVIVHVGRLDEQKGIDWLLQLMPRVFAELPGHDLLLVGAGPRRAELVALAGRLGVHDRVHFGGFREDVPSILKASEALVLASRWEGMPNVVLEAMAAGKPVVATDVEGVGEALGPAAAQQIVSSRNPDCFAEKLVALLKNRDLAAELGAENRFRAEHFFSLDAMAEAYSRLYRSLALRDF